MSTPPLDWARLAPDRASPLPRYLQLAEQVAELVADGTLPPGCQLPPERELAAATGISRMTVRQALADLARDGTVRVRHGVGAFVAEPKLTFTANRLLAFTDEAGRAAAVATRTIEQSVVAPPAPAAALLGLAAGEPVVRVVRLRLAGGEPVLLQISFLPADRFPGLETADLERQSLYALLGERYGIRLGGATQTLEAALAGPYQRRLLHLPDPAPLLVLDGVAHDTAGRPVEAFRAAYRADRAKFAVTSGDAPGNADQPVRVGTVLADDRADGAAGRGGNG